MQYALFSRKLFLLQFSQGTGMLHFQRKPVAPWPQTLALHVLKEVDIIPTLPGNVLNFILSRKLVIVLAEGTINTPSCLGI